MSAVSAQISMRWFGMEGPATSEKYLSHCVNCSRIGNSQQAQPCRIERCESYRLRVSSMSGVYDLGRLPGGCAQPGAVGTREAAEIVVKCVIVLDNDDYVLDAACQL
jgi:hypothetical protein